jgi:Transposase zinc-binding domain
LEVADIFRDHGPAWRQAHAGHVSLDQLKVMSAIERCRTAALGGHVARCEDCAYTTIAYNSCVMGKFRNGELATRCIGGSVDFGDLTLHYGRPLGPAISRAEVKGSFPQCRWPSGLNRFELLVGIHGAGKFLAVAGFPRPIHNDTRRRPCVAPERDLPSVDLGAPPL